MARFETIDLSVGYAKPLLNGISFTAEGGEVIGILGRNGCGKTTLLRGIAGSIRRFSGEVRIDGKSCSSMTTKQLAACLAVLPQQTEFIDGITARSLIEMGRYPYDHLFETGARKSKTKIEQNAALLHISHLLDADCTKLSQGQRQLVLLCRCLVQDTPVILLDEPNTALDYDNTHTMFTTVRSIAKTQNKTVLTVLHDPELALRYCDRILIIKEHRIQEALAPGENGQEKIETALKLLYPHVTVRKDPFDGHFRCYNQIEFTEERSLC